ncbi:MAG: gamma-glutamyltransferase [Alphaproteobacteria bacterium]|nr:gamma-glutamyltransferase [Alphaproteobacteria bacterium]
MLCRSIVAVALILAQAMPAAADEPVHATRQMVVAAHPLAAAAGLDVLRAGGSAVDAAVAVQAVLTLVEPQSSGIGGGAFLLHYESATRGVTAWDGRETAPVGARSDLFLDPSGKPVSFAVAAASGRAVGVPGVIRMLDTVHARFGKLPWTSLFSRAEALAREGFPVSPRLAGLLAGNGASRLRGRAGSEAIWFPLGKAPAAGDIVAVPALAEAFGTIAAEGAGPFYEGRLAAAVVAAVAAAADPGGLTADDLRNYRAIERTPLCLPYRHVTVCGMPPPSSGGIAVAQTLATLAPHDVPALGPRSPLAWHLFVEAQKLAFADRDRWVADPDAVPVPTAGLTDPAYLKQRATLMSPFAAMPTPVLPGLPPGTGLPVPPAGATGSRGGTSHFVIVDATGNAVSMTSSVEAAFGTGIVAAGFLLNNQLTDFSFVPAAPDGRLVVNRPGPGKRPRSTMSPTLVLDRDGRLLFALGSPGGPRIAAYVGKTLLGLIDWRLDVQAAIDLPHVVNRNGATEIEAVAATDELAVELRRRGHEVTALALESGLAAIAIHADGTLDGGADRRREGVALGD